jgi:putative salt-induced outer membrane protein YdiY
MTALLRPAALCAAAFVSLYLVTSAHAGKVTLTNDDVITGTITQSNETSTTVQHPDLGELVIPRPQIASVTMKKSDPAYVEPPVPDFFFGWDKSLAAGITGSDGNTETLSAYVQFDTEYENDTDRWFMHARLFYAEEDGENTRNEYEAGLTKDWLYPGQPEFFWANLLYEHDRFTGWQDRTSGFLGIGYDFVDDKDYTLTGRLGVGGNYEAGDVNEYTPELYAGLEGVWTINDNSSFRYYTTFFPSLDPAFREFRNVAGVAYKVTMDAAKGLSLKLGAENEYNSEVEPGTEKNDFKYYAALVLDF